MFVKTLVHFVQNKLKVHIQVQLQFVNNSLQEQIIIFNDNVSCTDLNMKHIILHKVIYSVL